MRARHRSSAPCSPVPQTGCARHSCSPIHWIVCAPLSCSDCPRQSCARKFPKFAVTPFDTPSRWLLRTSTSRRSSRSIGQRIEERGEASHRLRLRIGIAALLPRESEALGIEPGEQPRQELVAGHPPFGDQAISEECVAIIDCLNSKPSITLIKFR